MADAKAACDPDKCFEEAQKELAQGNLQQAKVKLVTAFQYGRDPDSVHALVTLSEKFAERELWREAEEVLLEALRVDPRNRTASTALKALQTDPERLYDIKLYYDKEAVDRIRKETVISDLPPVQLFIELTNNCNGKCVTCLNRTMKRERGIMDFGLFRKIVDESAENLNLEMVHLYGVGEAYLVPDVMEYFEYAAARFARRGTKTVLITNGERVTDLPGGVSMVEISFNAGRKETYERITGMSYDRTLDNIWRLEQEGQIDQRVDLRMLVFKDNEHEIEDFKKIFAYTSANLSLAYKYDNQCGEIDDKTLGDYRAGSRIPCHYVRRVMDITWNGDVILCPHDFEGSVKYGNVKTSSIRDIWYSDLHGKMLGDHAACRFEGLCEKCNFNLSIDGKVVVVPKEERIALRKEHADFAWKEMIRCEHASGCGIVKNYLDNMEEIEGGEEELVSVCSDDYRFYGLDVVLDPSQHPHCPALRRLRETMKDTRVCWEAPTFGPSGYAFAARGHMIGLADMGLRMHAHPILDCKVEIENQAGGADA